MADKNCRGLALTTFIVQGLVQLNKPEISWNLPGMSLMLHLCLHLFTSVPIFSMHTFSNK